MMIWQAVIAHAPGEEKLAETIASRLLEAGYNVSYRGTVLIGESFTEEASKALRAGGPVILCATINALGTGWAHHLINSTFAQANKKRIFALRMERLAYLDQILADIAVAEYWQDPEQGIHDLLRALRKHFPLETESTARVPTETQPPAFLDRLTAVAQFNPEALSHFRSQLREDAEGIPSASLDALGFLQRASLMREGFLTLTGVLLFGHLPTALLPSAFSRCVIYAGPTKAADRETLEARGTVIDQITSLNRRLAARVRTRQRVRADSPYAEVLYEYPMRAIREIIANALVHRDYEDQSRHVHVRLFTDRIEILSPGNWAGGGLPPDGSPVSLSALVSESIKRNLRLATVVAWLPLVEGEGSGLPKALEECHEISAPEPTVSFVSGFVKVTILPRSDWAETAPIAAPMVLAALHQLPTPPADFVGREEELERLSQALMQKGVAVLGGIQGMGGVGKTTLALKLAQKLTPSYPDAQIFLDLRGTDPKPLSPEQVMSYVIRSFRPEIRLPESRPELTGIYRSLLHGKRTLVLLDDVASAEQVEPLIPPAGNLLLITSRSHFTLPGLLSSSLSPLTRDEARSLLLRISPRIGEAADEIASLCGYLPLALRLVGATLAERPHLSAEEYLRRLAEAPGEKTPVTGSIRLSYDLLTRELQRYWSGLSVFPSSFERAAAEAVLALDAEDVDCVLGELVRNSLLEWSEQSRYCFHPLLRSFAESQLDKEEGRSLRLRHAEHYLEILARTSDLYEQGGEGVRRALELFDREWENVRSGFNWTAEHASQESEIARLCDAYPDAGAYCLYLRLSPRERIQWLESALEAACLLQDEEGRAVHLGNLGNAYMDLGDVDRAAVFYEQRLNIDRELGNRYGEGQALRNLGTVYLSRGDHPRGIALLEESLQIARELNDRRGEGIALNNLANAYKSLGDLQRAIDLYEQRLKIAREIGDRRGECIALGNLGIAYCALGETRRAAELFERQLAISRELGDLRGEGTALGSLGYVYASLSDAARALELYQQALPLLREAGDRPGEAEIAWAVGKVYEQAGDWAQAMAWMQRKVEYDLEIGHPEAASQAQKVQELRERLGVDAGGTSTYPEGE